MVMVIGTETHSRYCTRYGEHWLWFLLYIYQWTILLMSANIFRVVNPKSASQIWHAVKAPHHSSQSVRLPHQRSSWVWCTTPRQDVSQWRSSKASILKTCLPTSHPVSTLKRFIWVIAKGPVKSVNNFFELFQMGKKDKLSLCIGMYVYAALHLHHASTANVTTNYIVFLHQI